MEVSRREFLKASIATGAMAGVPGILLRPGVAEAAWAVSPALKKFVQPLPGLGPAGIPVATPNTTLYAGVDYYRITMRQFTQQLHPALGGPTTLWGYVDVTDPKATPVAKHLGAVIVAKRGTPVRINYLNELPPNHFLPVDTTIPGAGPNRAQNRAAPHLHGGFIPWPSDGGPFHWFAPGGLKGALVVKWLPNKAGTLTDDYWYPNEQSARLMWYHDHAFGLTRLNAYAGLATGYVLRDTFEQDMVKTQGLPDFVENGGNEIPLVIQDKIFQANGKMWYPDFYDTSRWPVAPGGAPPRPSAVPEFFGDTMLVNGVVYPFVQVEARRYRLRILNACNSRALKLRIVYAQGAKHPDSTEPDLTKAGIKLLLIGNESGFLQKPVSMNRVVLAPAERADIIVDFSNVPPGANLILYNDAGSPFPKGNPVFDFFPGAPLNPVVTKPGFGPNTRTLLQFRVKARQGAADPPLKLNLPPLDPPPIVPVGSMKAPVGVPVRHLTLNEVTDKFGRLMTLLGVNTLQRGTYGRAFLDTPTEIPKAGTTEVWEIANLTADTHPIHFHLVNVQVLSRQKFDPATYNGTPTFTQPRRPCDPDEMGWKETVRMNPGQVTRVLMKFDLPPDPVVEGKTVPIPLNPRLAKLGIKGHEYVWHCHILEHEEHDMMRPLIVVP